MNAIMKMYFCSNSLISSIVPVVIRSLVAIEHLVLLSAFDYLLLVNEFSVNENKTINIVWKWHFLPPNFQSFKKQNNAIRRWNQYFVWTITITTRSSAELIIKYSNFHGWSFVFFNRKFFLNRKLFHLLLHFGRT